MTHLQAFIYGDSDPEADVTNLAIFQRAAERLPQDAVWVVTNLRRTRQTAQAIARAGYPLPRLHVERDLREQGFGEWHGRLHAAHDAQRDDPYVGFWNCPPDEVPPGGESFVQVAERVAAAVDRLTERFRGKDIVCAAHGGTIRAALAHALAVAPGTALAFQIDNVSLTRVDRLHDAHPQGPGWRVRIVNS